MPDEFIKSYLVSLNIWIRVLNLTSVNFDLFEANIIFETGWVMEY